MNPSLPLDGLKLLPFCWLALESAVRVQQLLKDKHPSRVEPTYERDPDEHEFYLLAVGSSVARVLTCCEQLQAAPLLLTSYRDTPAMRKAGFTRHGHIVHVVESHLMRIQSLYDRVLKLLDAVFHLLNDPKNCRPHIILKNIKVQHHTAVVTAVKTLEKLVGRYTTQRNEVLHAGVLQDNQLRMLEMYVILEQSEHAKGVQAKYNYSELRKELTSEVLREKKREYLAFNSELAASLEMLLTRLDPCYRSEEDALRLRLGKPVT